MMTFRGNPHRRFYGHEKLPSRLQLLWKFETQQMEDKRLMGSGGTKLIWKGTGWSGQAAVVGNRVWLSSAGGFLYALNRHTGKLIWQFYAGGAIKSSVTYWNNRIYFGSRGHHLYCVNATTGKLLWKFRTPGKDVDSSPIIWKGRLYWGSEDSHLYAMDPLDGKIFWKYKTMGSIESSPTIVGEQIFINSYDGHLHALDLQTGKLRWRFKTGDDTDTTPTYQDGILYFGSENGLIYAVDAETGELQWERATDGGIWSTPAVQGDRLYVGSNDRRFYTLHAQTGRLIWRRIVREGIWASPVLVDGRLLFGDWAGYIYNLRAEDGALIDQFKTGDYIVSTAAVADNKVYLGSRDGFFYAFGGNTDLSPRRRLSRVNVETPKYLWPPPNHTPPALAYTPPDHLKQPWDRLLQGLRAKSPSLRLLLARRLAKIDQPTPLHQALLQQLAHDQADHVRLAAIQATPRFGAAAAPLAQAALNDPDDRVRAAACEALGRLNHRDALPAIRRLLWQRSALVRRLCGEALFALGQPALGRQTLHALLWSELPPKSGRPPENCQDTIPKNYLYRDHKGRLRKAPRSKRQVILTLLFLANQGDICARPHLLKTWYGCRDRLGREVTNQCSIFRDWQGWVKRWTPTLPMRFLPTQTRRNLLRIYGTNKRHDTNVQSLNLPVLAESDDPQKFNRLLALLVGKQYDVSRITAIQELQKRLDDPNLPQDKIATRLIALLRDKKESEDTREAAALALASFNHTKRNATLQTALQAQGDRIQAAAASTLLSINPQSTDALTILTAKRASLSIAAQCTALHALARLPSYLPHLDQALHANDPFLRICAFRALQQHPHNLPAWKDLLQRALQHKDPRISLRAALLFTNPPKH
jgi:outer membrane protein assembly factor BamB/HEAT repeat protein